MKQRTLLLRGRSGRGTFIRELRIRDALQLLAGNREVREARQTIPNRDYVFLGTRRSDIIRIIVHAVGEQQRRDDFVISSI